jgi:hypothetical protein
MKTALMRGGFGLGRSWRTPRTMPTTTLTIPSPVVTQAAIDLGVQDFSTKPPDRLEASTRYLVDAPGLVDLST